MDIKQQIADWLKTYQPLSSLDVGWLEVPKEGAVGDFALPCFRLTKEMKQPPAAIAADITASLTPLPSFIEEVAPSGPYINFFVKRAPFVSGILSQILDKGANFGKADIGQGRKVVVDYSSPNIGKPFHVGHLRSTIIGHALYNIFNFLGYESYSINFLGDWGTQFGKLICAYKLWGDEAAVKQEGIHGLNKLYIRFHDEAEHNPALNDDARAYFAKLEAGDEGCLALWRWFKDISMAHYEELYQKLGISFDNYNGESYYNDKTDAVISELQSKGLLKEDDGAMIVDLEEHKMPPCLILKRGGATIYATRDIASALLRYKEHEFAYAIYVTGKEQILHFKQWFKVVELMGYPWAQSLAHIPFGMINFGDEKMATRKGNVLYMDDLVSEATAKIMHVIEERSPNLPDKAAVASQVGIGAIKFNDLYNSRIKDIEFSWERMLNFEGETGPYCQYTHARCASVLQKALDEHGIEINALNTASLDLLTNDDEFALVKALSNFTDKVKEAASKFEPYILARYIVHIAASYNKFYHEHSILREEPQRRLARLALTYATKLVLSSSLKILGIESPNKM